METGGCYENYPLGTVAIANALNYSIWILGAFILSGFGILVVGLYLAFCIVMEFRILWRSCTSCYYYGKTCFMGLGRVCPLFFKKRMRDKDAKITRLDILTDMMVSIFPIIGGFVLLLISFSWLVLISLIAIALLTTIGNGFVRQSLACRYCKQRKIGCPAQKMFEKK